VVRDAKRVGGADVLDAEDVDEELGQFEDALYTVPRRCATQDADGDTTVS
jgi:hypothetical protein